MKDLLEYLVKSLVENPEGVVITEEESGEDVEFKISVDKDDMGRIIGKQGKIARAIRVVMRSAATKAGKKVNVEIIEKE
ncbi:MAG: KH domain-containing protein [Clostridia bacterium]|nr:KH domain-containing protein [Clostridia bacterium]MBR2328139.1 KH domain-containing protein [Clostridia bacterium]